MTDLWHRIREARKHSLVSITITTDDLRIFDTSNTWPHDADRARIRTLRDCFGLAWRSESPVVLGSDDLQTLEKIHPEPKSFTTMSYDTTGGGPAPGFTVSPPGSEAAPPPFRPGDVVRLRSKSPPLTVILVENEHAQCMWIPFQGDGSLHEECIPLVALELERAS